MRVVTGEISQEKLRFLGLLVICDCAFCILEFWASGVDEATGFADRDFFAKSSLFVELGVLLIILWDWGGVVVPIDEVNFLLIVSEKKKKYILKRKYK